MTPSPFQIRHASPGDIDEMSDIRMRVTENALTQSIISHDDYREFLQQKGQTWVATANNKVLGFATVNLTDNSIWALFVAPGEQGQGIGKALHDVMLNWSWQQGVDKLTLETEPGTKAEKLYRQNGWQVIDDSQADVVFAIQRPGLS